MPFHYGYWDQPERARAANELTIFEWDPISKQPHFKYAAVTVEKVSAPTTHQPKSTKPAHGLAAVANVVASAAATVKEMLTPERKHLSDYLGLLQQSELRLVKAFEQVRKTHPQTPDVDSECKMMGEWSRDAARSLDPFIAKYGKRKEGEPERLDKALLVQRKETGFDLLRDIHDLFLLVNESLISVTVLHQASLSLRDTDFQGALEKIQLQNERQREWLFARAKQGAPQVLVVPSPA